MSITDILYLSLVTATFVIFGIALAYADWVDKPH